MQFARRFVPWGISLAMVLVVGCAQSGRQGVATRGDERGASADSGALYVQLTAAQKDARAAEKRVQMANDELRRHIRKLAVARGPSQVTPRRVTTSKTAHTADATPQKRAMGSDVAGTRPPYKHTTGAKPKSTQPPIK